MTDFKEQAESSYKSGTVKLQSDLYEAAFVDFTKAIELSPYVHKYFESRGLARFSLKDNVGAIKDYSEALNIIENDSTQSYKRTFTFIYRGKAKAAIKDYEGAFDDLNRSLQVRETSTAYCERSNIKIEIGDFQGGYQDFVNGLSWDQNENVTIQFYERGFSKLSAAELIKAVIHCYTKIGNWDIASAHQLAVDSVLARRANEYRKLAKDKLDLGDYLMAKDLLTQARHLMPEKFNWYNEIKADIENIAKTFNV